MSMFRCAAIDQTNFAEVAQEIGPHYVMLSRKREIFDEILEIVLCLDLPSLCRRIGFVTL